MITVRKAKQIAKDWVEALAPNIPNFRGAFLTGSILWKNDDDPQPTTSDLDIRILVDLEDPKIFDTLGLKVQYQVVEDIIIETSFGPFQDFSSPEQILADFIWGAHLSIPSILSDPSGELSIIQKDVSEQFPKKKWVISRIEGARDFALMFFDNALTGTLEDRWLALAFALDGGLVQIPILAELRPPTVKKAGILFKKIMDGQRRPDLHEYFLKIRGCQSLNRVDVERHLEELTITFDRVSEIMRSPSLSDYSNPIARPLVIDGTWEMINNGYHREAMVWIGSMRSICQQTINQDGSDAEKKIFMEQYNNLLAELGFRSEDDFKKRAEDGKQLLDEVMQVAEQIMDANEKIVEGEGCPKITKAVEAL